MSSQGKLLILFSEWINKEGYEPLGENMWQRGMHMFDSNIPIQYYDEYFEPKDNEDLVNEFLNQLSKKWKALD